MVTPHSATVQEGTSGDPRPFPGDARQGRARGLPARPDLLDRGAAAPSERSSTAAATDRRRARLHGGHQWHRHHRRRPDLRLPARDPSTASTVYRADETFGREDRQRRPRERCPDATAAGDVTVPAPMPPARSTTATRRSTRPSKCRRGADPCRGRRELPEANFTLQLSNPVRKRHRLARPGGHAVARPGRPTTTHADRSHPRRAELS